MQSVAIDMNQAAGRTSLARRRSAAAPCPRCATPMQMVLLPLAKPARTLQALDCPGCHHTELLNAHYGRA